MKNIVNKLSAELERHKIGRLSPRGRYVANIIKVFRPMKGEKAKKMPTATESAIV